MNPLTTIGKCHPERRRMLNIALIAHDKKKDDMVRFVMMHRELLSQNQLFATGTTGHRIKEATGLDVTCYLSGPIGGDQQIGSLVAYGKVDLVIFLRDPLTSQPHEPDILALLRICDVHNVPAATNLVSADLLLKSLHDSKLSGTEICKLYE
jgi:methylglyoxal synthase